MSVINPMPQVPVRPTGGRVVDHAHQDRTGWRRGRAEGRNGQDWSRRRAVTISGAPARTGRSRPREVRTRPGRSDLRTSGTRLVDTATNHTRDDMTRADTIGGGFILFIFTLGGIVAEVGGDLPRGVAIAAAFAAAPGAVTIGLALLVVWPRMVSESDEPPVGSWLHARRQAGSAILRRTYLVADYLTVTSDQLWTLSQIVDTKNKRVRRAALSFATTVTYLALVTLVGAVVAL